MGAIDEVDETVDTDEVEEARDERDRSEIMDSGLERELATEGRREANGWFSLPEAPIGKVSIAHRLKVPFWTMAIAEQIDGRLEPQVLTAGVLEVTDDGVSCGVGRGPILANAGVGGARSGFGSKNRGRTVIGVGVVSCEVESRCMALRPFLVGVGVVGVARP